MKADIKQRWVEALRSESYQQGPSMLRSQENRFCCLGVLCDLVDPKGWQIDGDRFAHGGYIGHLPCEIRAVAIISDDQCFSLMGMNDNGLTFPTIADWIEANIPAES
jgi:hypothetical protein